MSNKKVKGIQLKNKKEISDFLIKKAQRLTLGGKEGDTFEGIIDFLMKENKGKSINAGPEIREIFNKKFEAINTTIFKLAVYNACSKDTSNKPWVKKLNSIFAKGTGYDISDVNLVKCFDEILSSDYKPPISEPEKMVEHLWVCCLFYLIIILGMMEVPVFVAFKVDLSLHLLMEVLHSTFSEISKRDHQNKRQLGMNKRKAEAKGPAMKLFKKLLKYKIYNKNNGDIILLHNNGNPIKTKIAEAVQDGLSKKEPPSRRQIIRWADEDKLMQAVKLKKVNSGGHS